MVECATAGEDEVLAAVSAMPADVAPPRANGELVFAAPWEGRAFGMATSLSDAGLYDWDAFRAQLVREVDTEERAGGDFDYYAAWLRAFERLLEAQGIVSRDELAERTAEFEFGERQEVF
jgi:nitrile hydratase accessory protein